MRAVKYDNNWEKGEELHAFNFTSIGGVAGSKGIHFLSLSVLSFRSSCLISSSSFFLFLRGDRRGSDNSGEIKGDLGDLEIGDSGI